MPERAVMSCHSDRNVVNFTSSSWVNLMTKKKKKN